MSFFTQMNVYCGMCLLLVLHYLCNVLYYITNYLFSIFTNCKVLFGRTYSIKSGSVSFISEEVKCYPKLPKHLAVIIEEQDISYNDCIKLILWCMHAGIPFITFYSCNSGKYNKFLVVFTIIDDSDWPLLFLSSAHLYIEIKFVVKLHEVMKSVFRILYIYYNWPVSK